MTSRPRNACCVLDANWDSTVRLFEQMEDRATLYFAKTRTIQQARTSSWSVRSCLKSNRLAKNQFERRFMFPSGWFNSLSPIFMPLLALLIRREMVQLNLGLDTLVVTYPQYLAAARKLEPKKKIYYCVDDYRGYWPDRSKKIEVMENDAIREVDLVLCTAKFMQEEFIRRVPESGTKIYHVPNGTRESFLVPQPLAKPDSLPDDISHIPRPILGYLGSIYGRINWDIVEAVLRRFPSASIVFIGPKPPADSSDVTRMERLGQFRNFHFLGPRPQGKIMDYIRSFDICLIPEPYEPLNVAGCPQKLWNYLASSRPIVSTRIPEQALWQPAVSIADSPGSFGDHIARLLAIDGNDGLAMQRLEVARRHTWPRLKQNLCELFEKHGLMEL